MARAGNFRERAVFETLTDSDDLSEQYGNPQDAWTEICCRKVDVVERPGRKSLEGGALQDVNAATLRVRADSVVNTIAIADRVYVRGQYWSIENAIQLDRKGRVREFLIMKGVAT